MQLSETYFPVLLAPGEKCAPCNTQMEYLLTLPVLHGLSGLSSFTQKNTFVLKNGVFLCAHSWSLLLLSSRPGSQ